MKDMVKTSNTTENWFEQRSVIFELLVPAIIITLGLQSLRVLVSSLTWTLGDRFALGAPILGLIALGIFSSVFLAGWLKKLLGVQRSIITLALVLGISRLLLQVIWLEPLVNTVLSMIASMSFIMVLPLYIDRVRSSGNNAPGLFVLGLLLGISLDSALHGVYGTYDIAWSNDFWSILFTLLLVTALFFFICKGRNLINNQMNQSNNIASPGTWSLLAIGPFLFLEMQVFQNIARLTTITGWELPLAFSWIMLGHLLGITFSAWFIFRPPTFRRITLYLLSAILLFSTIFPTPTGLLAGVYFLLGQVSASILMLFIILYSTIPGKKTKEGARQGATIPVGIGILIMAIFILGYYATYQIKLPFDNFLFEPVAAFIIVACIIPPGFKPGINPGYDQRLWFAPAVTIILVLFSFASMVTYQKPFPSSEDYSGSIKVMCYNLHNGFNTGGHLGLEALAKNIETLDPDIIALQEISRGWLVNGRVDMIEWLSSRLDMPYVYGETAGQMWGNAILSRYEITGVSSYPLPSENLPIERGFTHASVKISESKTIEVIATHFHHVEKDSEIRQSQASELLEYTNEAHNTIIMGDLNAISGDPEIEMFKSAGFIDVVSLIEPPPAYTFHADSPYQRIDYIWMSPEMDAEQIQVYQSNASDHLAIFAVIRP